MNQVQPRDPNPGGSPDAWETSDGRRLVPRPSTIDRLTAERDAALADNAAMELEALRRVRDAARDVDNHEPGAMERLAEALAAVPS